MNAIILPLDMESAEKILRRQTTMLPWIKNFKRPVDRIVIAIKAPIGQLAIGAVGVESKAWVNKYTASNRIMMADVSLPKMYWYDFEKSHKVCLFSLTDKVIVFDSPILVENLAGIRNIGSGMYLEEGIDDNVIKMLEGGLDE